MTSQPERVTLVNTSDTGGGAESTALSLHVELRTRGIDSTLLVGRKDGVGVGVQQLPNWEKRPVIQRAGLNIARRLDARADRSSALRYLATSVRYAVDPLTQIAYKRGREYFRYRGARDVLLHDETVPEVVHLHNLHGSYFDLRILPELSHQVPTAWTLHDEWAYTGHCASTFDCLRWMSGCGSCPYLDTYPAIRSDGTNANLGAKTNIYTESQIHVSAPSDWLLERATASVLRHAIVSAEVIRPGVDLSIFRPYDRATARLELGLEPDNQIVLVVANDAPANPFKDWRTARAALHRLGSRDGINAICIGAEKPSDSETDGITFIPYLSRKENLARWYQAADIMLHAAHAEVFGLTIAESLACGTPVVATNIGGIPEVFGWSGNSSSGVQLLPQGFLIPPRDPGAMADAAWAVISDKQLHSEMSRAASTFSRTRFGLSRYVDDTLGWYSRIIAGSQSGTAR